MAHPTPDRHSLATCDTDHCLQSTGRGSEGTDSCSGLAIASCFSPSAGPARFQERRCSTEKQAVVIVSRSSAQPRELVRPDNWLLTPQLQRTPPRHEGLLLYATTQLRLLRNPSLPSAVWPERKYSVEEIIKTTTNRGHPTREPRTERTKESTRPLSRTHVSVLDVLCPLSSLCARSHPSLLRRRQRPGSPRFANLALCNDGNLARPRTPGQPKAPPPRCGTPVISAARHKGGARRRNASTLPRSAQQAMKLGVLVGHRALQWTGLPHGSMSAAC